MGSYQGDCFSALVSINDSCSKHFLSDFPFRSLFLSVSCLVYGHLSLRETYNFVSLNYSTLMIETSSTPNIQIDTLCLFLFCFVPTAINFHFLKNKPYIILTYIISITYSMSQDVPIAQFSWYIINYINWTKPLGYIILWHLPK